MAAFASTPPGGWTANPHLIWEKHIDYDLWSGQPSIVTSNGGNTCTSLGYDTAYSQLPTYTAHVVGAGCNGNPLITGQTWDRGLEVVTSTSDQAGALTTISYDAFGRPTDVFEPDPNPLRTRFALE